MATIKGIVPAEEATVTDLASQVQDGHLGDLETTDGAVPPILLGRDLASTLGVGRGDVVAVMSPKGTLSPFGMLPRNTKFRVAGTEKAVTLPEIALAVFAAHDLPDGLEPNLDAEATYDPENFSFPHGTHLCATEVDTETGHVRIRSYVCVDDIGHVVNPLIVDGQVHGGLAQGIAQTMEHFRRLI